LALEGGGVGRAARATPDESRDAATMIAGASLLFIEPLLYG
jgi:hypothetical protein